MNKELKCTICGSLLGIIIFINLPICKRCLLYIEENPHTAEREYYTGPLERDIMSGIISTTTAYNISTDLFNFYFE